MGNEEMNLSDAYIFAVINELLKGMVLPVLLLISAYMGAIVLTMVNRRAGCIAYGIITIIVLVIILLL